VKPTRISHRPNFAISGKANGEATLLLHDGSTIKSNGDLVLSRALLRTVDGSSTLTTADVASKAARVYLGAFTRVVVTEGSELKLTKGSSGFEIIMASFGSQIDISVESSATFSILSSTLLLTAATAYDGGSGHVVTVSGTVITRGDSLLDHIIVDSSLRIASGGVIDSDKFGATASYIDVDPGGLLTIRRSGTIQFLRLQGDARVELMGATLSMSGPNGDAPRWVGMPESSVYLRNGSVLSVVSACNASDPAMIAGLTTYVNASEVKVTCTGAVDSLSLFLNNTAVVTTNSGLINVPDDLFTTTIFIDLENAGVELSGLQLDDKLSFRCRNGKFPSVVSVGGDPFVWSGSASGFIVEGLGCSLAVNGEFGVANGYSVILKSSVLQLNNGSHLVNDAGVISALASSAVSVGQNDGSHTIARVSADITLAGQVTVKAGAVLTLDTQPSFAFGDTLAVNTGGRLEAQSKLDFTSGAFVQITSGVLNIYAGIDLGVANPTISMFSGELNLFNSPGVNFGPARLDFRSGATCVVAGNYTLVDVDFIGIAGTLSVTGRLDVTCDSGCSVAGGNSIIYEAHSAGRINGSGMLSLEVLARTV
jgi:hypothetical protein